MKKVPKAINLQYCLNTCLFNGRNIPYNNFLVLIIESPNLKASKYMSYLSLFVANYYMKNHFLRHNQTTLCHIFHWNQAFSIYKPTSCPVCNALQSEKQQQLVNWANWKWRQERSQRELPIPPVSKLLLLQSTHQVE